MHQIGYSLVNTKTKKEIECWGNTPLQCAGVPNIIKLPNGNIVHCPSIDFVFEQYKLVKRYLDCDEESLTLKENEIVTFDGEKIVVTYEYRSPSKEELLSYSARKRYEKEIQGITVSDKTVFTDRQSQAMITGIVTLVNSNPSLTIKFKTSDGFIEANSVIMSQISSAVANHIQNCFNIEYQVAEKISLDELSTFDEINSLYS